MKIQSVSIYVDIAKFDDFLENADIDRTQAVYHMTYIFFESSFGKVYMCQVLSMSDMCATFYWGVSFCPQPHPPIRTQPWKPPSWIGFKAKTIQDFYK